MAIERNYLGILLLFSWQVYEGLAFKLSLKFPEKYPYEAPTIKFVTPCFHPNVDAKGNICLDTLKVMVLLVITDL